MHSSVPVFVVLLGFASSARAQSLSFGNCPSLETVTNFDLTRVISTWLVQRPSILLVWISSLFVSYDNQILMSKSYDEVCRYMVRKLEKPKILPDCRFWVEMRHGNLYHCKWPLYGSEQNGILFFVSFVCWFKYEMFRQTHNALNWYWFWFWWNFLVATEDFHKEGRLVYWINHLDAACLDSLTQH